MSTAKEHVRDILDRLDDDASLEDIQYHIYVQQKIHRGLRDVEAGRVISQDQAEQRMGRWIESSGGRKSHGAFSSDDLFSP